MRFSEQHAVEDILGLDTFDEGDLYKALDSLSLHQEEIEQKLYKTYLKNKGGVPTLVLFDVTSSYFEGEHNELAAFGYNRDGKKGKRYILMRNDAVYSKEEKRRDDKLKKLEDLIQKRNDFVKGSSRACAEGGMKTLQVWLKKYKMNTYITLSLTEKEISYHQDLEAQIKRPMLDGCYVIVTDVKKETLTATEVHRSYMQLQRVERDFRILKTGFLEVRPIFVRKKERTKRHVLVSMLALKIVRYFRKKLEEAQFPYTLQDALDALARYLFLEQEISGNIATLLPQPDPIQAQVFKALGIKLPLKGAHILEKKCRQLL